MKIVCLGDSLTFGYGVLREERWVELLKSELSAEFINKGINGDSTTGMLSRFYTDVIKKVPTHAIIMGGTNDFIGGRSVPIVIDNITMMVQECISNNITPIIAIQPPIIGEVAKIHWAAELDYARINSNIEEYRQSMILYSLKNKIPCADLFKSFGITAELGVKEYYTDGIHLSGKGNKVVADILSELLSKYFK